MVIFHSYVNVYQRVAKKNDGTKRWENDSILLNKTLESNG